MAKFGTSTRRVDPYKNFKFRMKWDGRYVAGASKVSRLTSSTGAQALDGRFEPITIERAVTHDSEFEQWAAGLAGATAVREGARDVGKRNLTIELHNEAGRVAFTYRVRNAWVSEYQALPDLDADANTVAIGKLKLEHEAWTRSAAKSE